MWDLMNQASFPLTYTGTLNEEEGVRVGGFECELVICMNQKMGGNLQNK